MARHIRQFCKIANSDEGMEMLMEHAMQKQMHVLRREHVHLQAQNATLTAQVGRIADMMEKQLAVTRPPPITLQRVDARTTNHISVNIIGFDRENRISIPARLVKAAFTENPRLIEYCRMTDQERTDAERAAPYVLEALVDLVRRAHRDPVYRNIYLSPNRSDQVMVCIDDEESSRIQGGRPPGSGAAPPQRTTPQRWEVRPLIEAIRLLFDGVANDLHQLIMRDEDRTQLPLDVQSAASWVPNLYENEPDRFVASSRGMMMAHLQNTRPTSDS